MMKLSSSLLLASPESQEPPKSAAEPPKFPVEPLYFPEEPVYPQILSRIHPLICVSANLRPRSLGANSRIAMVVLKHTGAPNQGSGFSLDQSLETG